MDVDTNSDHQPASEPLTDERPTAGPCRNAGAGVQAVVSPLASPPANRKSKKSPKQSLKGKKALGKKSGKKAKDSFDDRQLDMFELFATLLAKDDRDEKFVCASICEGTGSLKAGEADDSTASQIVATLGSNATDQP